MSTYQKSLIDEARPDEGNSLLPSETRKDKKPMELNHQRLLKAIAVLFVASCALSYAIRGSNNTVSEAFLVSTQSTEPNMFASSEPNMFASSESRYVPLSPGRGYVLYHHARCTNLDALVPLNLKKANSEEDCVRVCKYCHSAYFSYDKKSGKCLHFYDSFGDGDCEPNEDNGFDSFKFVDYGKCDIDVDDELEGSGDDADSLRDCQNLCTKNDECKAYQWFDDGIIPPKKKKCILYSESVDSITNNDATCYKEENNQTVYVGHGWCMKPTNAYLFGFSRPVRNLEACEYYFRRFLLHPPYDKIYLENYMEFTQTGDRNSCWLYRRTGERAETGGVAVAVCQNKAAGHGYVPIFIG